MGYGGIWNASDVVLWRDALAQKAGVKKISQKEAAGFLGVSTRSMAKWEKGDTPIDKRTSLACRFIFDNLDKFTICRPSAEKEFSRRQSEASESLASM